MVWLHWSLSKSCSVTYFKTDRDNPENQSHLATIERLAGFEIRVSTVVLGYITSVEQPQNVSLVPVIPHE